MGGDGHPRPCLQQLLQERLRDGHALFGIGAAAHLVHEHQAAASAAAEDLPAHQHVSRKRAQVPVHALHVPDVRQDVEEVHPCARLGGDGHPVPCHQRQQPQELQHHRLAARIGSREDQPGASVRTDVQVVGHHLHGVCAEGEHRVSRSRGAEDSLLSHLGDGSGEDVAQAHPGQDQVQLRRGSDAARQMFASLHDGLGEDSEEAAFLGPQLGFGPAGVVGGSHQLGGFHVEGASGAGDVVDDAPHPVFEGGREGHDEAAVHFGVAGGGAARGEGEHGGEGGGFEEGLQLLEDGAAQRGYFVAEGFEGGKAFAAELAGVVFVEGGGEEFGQFLGDVEGFHEVFQEGKGMRSLLLFFQSFGVVLVPQGLICPMPNVR
mmetsp:Transcript_20365/g.46192  ORF Transcript_20365/g.46192 Transcript_20365/m.46192 type:complete len:376 (-) Transcript_20365:394-1521(-)